MGYAKVIVVVMEVIWDYVWYVTRHGLIFFWFFFPPGGDGLGTGQPSFMRGRRSENYAGGNTIFNNNLLKENLHKKFARVPNIWTKAPIFFLDINNIHTNW